MTRDDARELRRRSRQRNAPVPTVTAAELAAWWEEIGAYACVACGAPYEHADHVQPLAKGGEHSVFNLLPLCAPCNLAKSDLDPFEWLTCNLGVDFRPTCGFVWDHGERVGAVTYVTAKSLDKVTGE